MHTTARTGIATAMAAILTAALLFMGMPALGIEQAQAAQGQLAAQSANGLTTQAAAKSKAATAARKAGLVSGHTYILYSAVGSNVALDLKAASKSDGANVHVWSLHRATNQQWVVKFNAKGYATIKSALSGKYLTATGSKKSGSNVVQQKGGAGKAQRWIVSKNSDGTLRFRNAANKSCSLDVRGAKSANGTNVGLWKNNNTKAQKWKLYDVTKMRANLKAKAVKNKGLVKAGTYIIYSKVGSSTVLDINGGSSANGANAQIYHYNGSYAQKFTIAYDKNGYAVIRTGTGKYLDVKGAGLTSKTNVHQYAANSTLAQRWIISKNSDGTFRIQSALWAGLSLDVNGASAANKTNVQVYASNKTKAQKWVFKTPSAAAAAEAAASQPKVTTPSLNGIAKSSYDGISLDGASAAGIDVSVWNGDIDWYKVAASGIRFAIIRCGYGDDYYAQDDSKFLQNVRGARAAGLDIGVYLYSYAVRSYGEESAQSEANHTLRLLKEAGLTPSNCKYGVYYDVEDGSQEYADLTSICSTYCNAIRNEGYSVGVYSYLNWWNTKLTSSQFNNWNRWIAQWPYKTGGQRCQYGGSYKVWQCMSDGSVPGIVGNVDMNLAY